MSIKLLIKILVCSQLTPFSASALFADNASPKYGNIEEKLKIEQNIGDYAISKEGKYLLLVRKQPLVLELLNGSDLNLLKTIPIAGVGDQNKKIDFVFNAASRQSFIVGLGESNQLWEILYEDNPSPVYNGVMHDYRLDEGLVRDQSKYPVRIIAAVKSNNPFSSYYLYDARGLLFLAREKNIEVLQLDARQNIATIGFKVTPDLKTSKVISVKGHLQLFIPPQNNQDPAMLNMESWTVTQTRHNGN